MQQNLWTSSSFQMMFIIHKKVNKGILFGKVTWVDGRYKSVHIAAQTPSPAIVTRVQLLWEIEGAPEKWWSQSFQLLDFLPSSIK